MPGQETPAVARWAEGRGFKSHPTDMPETWRECPSCHDWRTDVRRDPRTGALEACAACDPHEFGRCECCGYKPDRLKPAQEQRGKPITRAWLADLARTDPHAAWECVRATEAHPEHITLESYLRD